MFGPKAGPIRAAFSLTQVFTKRWARPFKVSLGFAEKIHEDECMRLKNGLFILWISLSFNWVAERAHAVVYPDQEVTSQGNNEDENTDAVSSFGEAKRQTVKIATKPVVLAPISESSFAHEAGRAPASGAGRSPAGASGIVEVKPTSTNKTAVKRQIQKTKAFQEVAVIANDLGFFPSTIFLTEGIPVRMYITGSTQKSQCFLLDQFGVRRQIRNQKIEEVTFTPDQSGTFSFHCPMNGAKGTLVVKEMDLDGGDQRAPASVQSEAHAEMTVPVPSEPRKKKTSLIRDEDFSPEFRN